jgi:hypothetical protein
MEIAFLGVIYGENFEDEISYARLSRKKSSENSALS